MLEGGAMMGKDYMLAIIIVNYDGENHSYTCRTWNVLLFVVARVRGCRYKEAG